VESALLKWMCERKVLFLFNWNMSYNKVSLPFILDIFFNSLKSSEVGHEWHNLGPITIYELGWTQWCSFASQDESMRIPTIWNVNSVAVELAWLPIFDLGWLYQNVVKPSSFYYYYHWPSKSEFPGARGHPARALESELQTNTSECSDNDGCSLSLND
jgi:hypothetical protein